MANKDSDYPSSQSDGDDVDPDQEEQRQPVNNNVANILARLQSTGALIKKLKKECYCFTCELDFPDREELYNHLIQHVSLPNVELVKLPSDDEDGPPSEDENWFDEEESTLPKMPNPKTPQKLDISEILKNKGLSIKKNENFPNSTSALDKLSSLGLTIKNNATPIKKEKPDTDKSDVMQRLGKLGGIKLTLKSDGSNTNTFKVVNGLKDFKASDDEDEASENERNDDDDDNDNNLKIEESNDKIKSRTPSESDDSNSSKTIKFSKTLKVTNFNEVEDQVGATPIIKQAKPRARPTVKQTPTRANLQSQNCNAEKNPEAELDRPHSNSSTETIIIKKEETDSTETRPLNAPLFSGQIKTERMSPTLPDSSTPIVTKIKTENDTLSSPITTMPLKCVTKTEEPVTVIEINGDSNDEDDDCCVVSTTPAPDIKPKTETKFVPIAPKIEEVSYPSSTSYSASAFSLAQTNHSSASGVSQAPTIQTTEKQHSFDWNAPDSKPAVDIFEKSADDIFDSLISTGKRENMISDANEYISIDKLGSQHTCDVCNTRFTDISLLEDHRKMTGHSQSLVASSSLLPYNNSPNIISSLLPVKQIADQVGKLSSLGNNSGFTHQQNVMINIQAYPGGGGVMMPGQTPYNTYQSAPNYTTSNNMYGPNGQPMSEQFAPGNYMDSNIPYGQYPSQMSKPGYPSTMSQNTYPPHMAYSGNTPLQAMQQAVYGQTGIMNQPGAMGPPPAQPYAPVSSPGGLMKPPSTSGVTIQNVQTFPPGQLGMSSTGQGIDQKSSQAMGQMLPPPLRVTAGPTGPQGSRPRMPSIRPQSTKSSVRSGVQVHGQIRGSKISQRMPLKRTGGATGGPGTKRRPDMLLPGKHDNEDCQVMAMQKQREGLPLIHSVQGAKDKLGSQISITKKTVNKEANAMANVLASRGISIKQKQKSRSPTPERPLPHIPNLGSGVSIKHTSKSSNFSIPEAKVGGGMASCKICKKMFGSYSSLQVHMANAHPQGKVPSFKCDECPASYPKSLQLQHHKRVFHNMTGANKELGLPVVDLSQIDNIKRLSNLGIYSFIPLANREQANGCFGIPVISVHNMNSGMTSNLQALGADGLLSLGPLKPLPNT
ncbi:uncharacterized protein LOC123706654 [Pieris brassicae]|uniref:uncharacterized protein LOC123706654 n=1 Tax=Pieris brassicae TaxID=7116 RepID=UPI001E660453|nr:uncharacterized protein LOC123706654 [Pieris brassicae]XP_045511890.1 uncharacterized protein LOC123706654 [Pieris brassicae]XP_045511891.1 uncharacterized protein LOC123706654 [Pieris brassicae]